MQQDPTDIRGHLEVYQVSTIAELRQRAGQLRREAQMGALLVEADRGPQHICRISIQSTLDEIVSWIDRELETATGGCFQCAFICPMFPEVVP